MPIGPPNRPQEPLYVFRMALALALAAFTGGALGLVWYWLTEENGAQDQLEASVEQVAAEAEADEEDDSEPPTPPQPSPNPR